MKIEGKKLKATFLKRLNRFEAQVLLNGEVITVHVPNSGRLKELLLPGAEVILLLSKNKKRKHEYDIILVEKDSNLVSIDSFLPSKLAVEEIKKGALAPFFNGLKYVKTEVRYKESRFDIGLGNGDFVNYFLEVKGVTLVEKGIALFPDAPTERGTKHLKHLIEAKKEGYGAGVIFIVQRKDAVTFSPNAAMDRDFAEKLFHAQNAGVDVLAFNCEVELNNICIKEKIKVVI
ncbi:MAG: DNA/RNA nuclease SfsA [Thermovenabulum sp.]|uniref:DNA/RNA nuclease SfsA n=1 Tax=Thermovenabulum sp. TaxID=3100335 RepID=UPI003C7BEC77